MKLSDVSVGRPVFVTMMMLALVVLGYFSYTGLSVDMMPDVDFPFTVVQTVYPGASAESMETDVTKKIEDAVNQISGVRHITSQSREGYSLVVVEFHLEKDGMEATNDVREKVAGVRNDLPDEIEEPIVSQYDPTAQPIISIAVSGKRTPKDITEIAKNRIKKRLESVQGVGAVDLIGGSEREILVALDPHRMESRGVTVADIQYAIQAANLEIPGGRVAEASREYLVRVMGRLERVTDFNNVIVKTTNGVPVYLQDIASVHDTTLEQRSLARLDGQPAVSLSVVKQSGANTVEIAAGVEKVLEQLKAELPPDIKMSKVEDNSTFIKDSIHEILFNIQYGMLLAVIVIFLFLLDLRPTIIAGLSIPISLVATFTIMKLLGFTINVLTLLGLSLAVGILIDDAIVVMENIYRHIHMGKSPIKAAMDATKEIGLAVMATTFSIVVVFVPVAFMEGLIGRFFYQFGMTVAFAVVISLFVALTLTPMLSSRWLREGEEEAAYNPRGKGLLARIWGRIFNLLNYWNRAFDWFKPKYESLLASSLRHRWLVMLIAILSFVGSMYLATVIGVEFMTETDQSKMAVTFQTPPGTTLHDTSERAAQIEAAVRNSIPEVIASYVTIGSGNNPVTDGRILFNLSSVTEREISARRLMDSVRVLIAPIPGIKTSVSRGESEGGGDKSIEISVRGEDLSELTRISAELKQIFYRAPGAIDIDDTQEKGKPEFQIRIDRKLAEDLGLSLATIPMTVRALVEGDVVTRFKEGTEEYDVRIRLDEPFRTSADDIGRILVASNKEIPGTKTFLVPLNRVGQLEKSAAIGQYNRYDRQREIKVNANVASDAFAGTVTSAIMTEVATLQVPPGYFVGTVGEQEIMNESFQNIVKSLILAIIFIYLLLASQYESFFDPLSIMLSLPLSMVGAIPALLGQSFSIMSMIGIVLLMGLVTKNAILLIDFVKQQRGEGMGRTEAILKAGPIRLRPILMTTFAMVFGMAPLALGLGPGAELRLSMARAVIGGIISSTLLTLVVVPVMYTLVDDFVGLFKRKEIPKARQIKVEGVVIDSQTDRPF
ncbi:MAG: efflux RND transporter permease subunit [bacterium]|nr:efflux RND transporter permease subunit [bacterium]